MTPAELRAAATAVFGGRWQTALARVVEVRPRQVRRWAAGTTAVPAAVAISLVALAAARTAPADTADELAAWSVDRRRRTVRHRSGIVLRFSPHPDGGWSGAIVAGLDAVRLADPVKFARLMRQGGDAWARAIQR